MKFEKEMVYTGISKRISKKTNTEYILVNLLDEEGVQVSCIARCEIPQNIEKYQDVNVIFNLTTGRYNTLVIEGLE